MEIKVNNPHKRWTEAWPKFDRRFSYAAEMIFSKMTVFFAGTHFLNKQSSALFNISPFFDLNFWPTKGGQMRNGFWRRPNFEGERERE